MQFKATLVSAIATGTSLAATFNGDNVVAVVTCIVNVAVLLTTAIIDIYRKWRDRDKDLKKDGDK